MPSHPTPLYMRNNYNSLSIYKKTVKIFNLNLRSFERLSSLLSSTIAWISAWAIVKNIELKYEFAGLGGEMMFGPEIEAGSLHNCPYTQGSKRIKFARL
jgi:hypothetical protein